MKVRRLRSSSLAVVAMVAALSACGASAPPARELADEIIDTLEVDGVPVSDDIKACMHAEVADFQLTAEEAQGFEDFDDVANKAAEGQPQAQAILDRFEEALASCNTAG